MTEPDLSIIIVNWNGLSDTKECIETLNRLSYKDYEIILVDNGSEDNSVSEFRKWQKTNKKIVIVTNKKNLGFAGGNNAGYRKARGKFILFLNNDTLVPKNFLQPLIKKITSAEKIGAVQPKILNYPEKSYIDSVGSYFLTSGFLYHLGHNKKDMPRYNRQHAIFTMKGACMLFKREVLDLIGVFDHKYFAYFEETDLCQRTWIAGYKIYTVPESVIFHKGGQTAKKLPSSFVNYHSYKNRIYTYLKNFDLLTILRVIPKHVLLCEMASFMYFVTLQFNLGWAIQKAVLWNLSHFGSLRRDREAIRKIRKVRDEAYLPPLTRSVRLSYYYHLFSTALVGYKD